MWSFVTVVKNIYDYPITYCFRGPMAYLKKTKKANILGESVKGFPLLFWDNNKIHWLSLSYFIELYRSDAVRSLGTYAQHIQDIYSQIEIEENIHEISDIDDDFLRAYKSSIISRGEVNNTKNYASQIIATILRYCMWLEENGYSRNLIGTSKFHRIRIILTDKGHIKHPLSKNKSSDKKTMRAPRTDWIEIIKKFGPATERVNKRFELMIDWGRVSGVRGDESCHLSIRQLPTHETVEKAILNGRNIFILLTHTKGSNDKSIPVNPMLVKRTWDYIDAERKSLVKIFKSRSKKKKESYKECDFIFLSEKTGTNITPGTFSTMVRAAFLKAVEATELTEDERVWCHGLRHNFVVTTLIKFDEKGVPRPEAVAQQATRHSSTKAMEPYLTERFNKDF
jgi:integrase